MLNARGTFFATVIFGLLLNFSSEPLLGQKKSTTEPSPDSLQEVLKENRHSLDFKDGSLEGEGRDWIREEAKNATVITLGEMHGTREIPQLMQALVDDLNSQYTYDYLALEVSPWTTKRMSDSLKKGEDAYNRLIKKYPQAIPFYNAESEGKLIQNFVENSGAEESLWGLDQIFAFSTEMVFDRLIQLAPSPKVEEEVQKIQERGASKVPDDSRLRNLPSNIPMPISVYDPATFEALKKDYDGIPEAQTILEEVLQSIKIYRLNDTDNYVSNQMRARYLWQNLQSSAAKADSPSSRIIVKTGAKHAYRSRTPNNALDIGNLSVSMARSSGGEALNVAVLCGPGSQMRTFPSQTNKCEPAYLGDSFKNLSREKPVLFDLHEVHRLLHNKSLEVDKKLEEFLWGFDAVIIIPKASAAKPMKSSVGRAN